MSRVRAVRGARRLIGQQVWAYRFRKLPRQGAALEALRRQQWLPYEAQLELQSRKLQELIRHAYAHVPYYRRVMDERGIRSEEIRSADDLARLPLLTKDVIRAHGEELRATGGVERPELIQANHTGGSTGVPLDFYQDDVYRDYGLADLLRNYEMCGGYRLGDPVAFLWGSDYDNRPHRTLRGKLRNAVSNLLYLDAFDSGEAELLEYARRLAGFRPRLLVGYVSSLTLLARVIEAHRVPGVRVGAIQSSAETLTPAQREILERTFKCQVYDRYGCREVGNVAHECDAHVGLHVLSDNNLVEILRDGRPVSPGEEGELVVTNLNNKAMPFIRYVIGDLGVAGSPDERCPCGRGLPLMRKVTGRSADIIVAPSGKLLHGEFFTHLFYKIPTVRELQVIQRSPTQLEISLVPDAGFDEGTVTEFLRGVIREYGDAAFEISFIVTDRIAASASGKFRFTLSDVPVQLAGQAQGVR